MSNRFDAEQVSNLTLEARGWKIEGRHRDDGRIFARDFFGGVQEPVLTSVGEEVVNLKKLFVWPIIRDHEEEFGFEVDTEEPGQLPRRATGDPAMQFVTTLDMDVGYLALEVLCQC